MGAPAEVLEATRSRAKDEEESFEVWPENWPAIEMFLRMSTQWNFAGTGARVGLNYQALESLFRIFQVKKRKGLFEDIRVIEASALQSIWKREEGG